MIKFGQVLAKPCIKTLFKPQCLTCNRVQSYSKEMEKNEDFVIRINQLLSKDLDPWWVRKVLNEIHHQDAVPHPDTVKLALKAIRSINDFALAVRFIEAVKFKSLAVGKEMWAHISSEIEPSLKELGIPTLTELGYDKPELFTKDSRIF